MAGVIKSKGAQVFSNKVAPLNTDTGSELIGNALARATSRIADTMYSEAVAEQKELGRTTALNTPIRDENDKLTYVDITKTMSQVARDAARPIIERDYALAIKGDMNKVIREARLEAGEDQERFKELSTTKLKGLMDAVPDDFKSISKTVLEESGSQTQAEHYYDMSIKAAAKQKRIALENLQVNTRDQIDEIIPLIISGDISSAQEMYQNIRDQINGSRTPDGEVVHEGFIAEGFTDQNVRALNMELDKAYFGTLLSKDHTQLMANGDYELAQSLMRSLHTGKIDMSGDGINAAKLAEIGITQDDISAFADPDVRQSIAADMRITASSFADSIRANASAVENRQFLKQWAKGFGATGKKAEEQVQTFYDTVGVTADMWRTPEAMARLNQMANQPAFSDSSTALSLLMSGNVRPAGLQNALISVAQGNSGVDDEVMVSLMNAWARSSLGGDGSGSFGDPMPKGLPKEVQSFWANVNNHIKIYGTANINEATIKYRSTNAQADRMSAIGLNFDSSTPERTLNEHLLEEGIFEGYPPNARRIFSNVVKDYYSQMEVGEADDALKTALASYFTKSKYVRHPYSDVTIDRSEYAPEAIYTGASIEEWRSQVNKKLNTVGSKYTIGMNAFVTPRPDSTNSNIVWTLIDEDSNPIMRNGRPLTISSRQINTTDTMQTIMQTNIEERIAKAQEARRRAKQATVKGKIDKVGDRLTELGKKSEADNNE